MSTTSLVLLVVAALLAVSAVAVLAAVLVRRLRTRTRQLGPRLRADLEASGEVVLRGPEAGSYRGGSAPGFSKVKGNCLVALTGQRVVYRMFVGEGGEIARHRIVGVREDASFLGSRVGGQTHLVLQLDDGEVGFFVEDRAGWVAALRDDERE